LYKRGELTDIYDEPSTGSSYLIAPEKGQSFLCFPNPTSKEVTIQFDSDGNTKVRIEIFNLLGEKMKTFQIPKTDSGSNNLFWDGKNETGKIVNAGTYFVRLKTANSSFIQKIVLLGNSRI